MKLILEAIKSLFRKVECGFSAVRDYADSKVSAESKKLTVKIREVGSLASDAADTAAVALSKALDAKNLATYVLPGTLSTYGNSLSVTHPKTLQNGQIFTIVPDKTSDSNDTSPYILFNNQRYTLVAGIPNDTKYGSVSANRVFKQNVPIVVMFDKSNARGLVLTRLSEPYLFLYLENDQLTSVPEFVPGFRTHQGVCRYKYMRVKSSTEGSTKLFDIQVDDEGKLQTVDMDGNVVIPQGGGGGGAGWKTVVDYTLTEGATDIIVDADANGNPFSLVFAAFAIFVPANPENTAAETSYWWYFDSSNKNVFRDIGSITGSQTNDRYIVGNVSTYGEGHKSAVTSIRGNGNFGPQDGSYLDEYFSYLRIVSKTDGNFFPVGTRVVIAGIPADGGDGE